MTMTKADIVDSITEKIGIPKKDCIRIVDSVFEVIKDDLCEGNDVKISGFGKWSILSKRERVGRNPQTGEEMKIEARKVVTFKSSNVLRDSVNQ
jgi:integration host factor subunit alpha